MSSITFFKFQQISEDAIRQSIDNAVDNMEWTSLYIPLIPNKLILETDYGASPLSFTLESEYDFINLFESKLYIGKVKRVDFVVRDGVKSAFVHFHHWFNNANSLSMHDTIDASGSVRVNGFYSGAYYFGIRTSIHPFKQPFLTFKRNFKAIPEVKEEDVPQNVHQIIHWNKTLVEENAVLQERIKELETQLQEMSNSAQKKKINPHCEDCALANCVCTA